MKRFALIALILLVAPLTASAQDAGSQTNATVSTDYSFTRNGVFGCSMNGSYAMSVGALSAVGGVFVPVNDAAVTLNTGYLVYKECVLRGIVDRQREAATAAIQAKTIKSYETGNNGQPLYSVSLTKERLNTADQIYVKYLQGGYLNTLNPVMQTRVKQAIAQGYMAGRNAANNAFVCPYTDLNSLYSGKPTGSMWAALSAVGTPACDPLLVTARSSDYIAAAAGAAENDMMTQLQWGQGTYPVMGTDADGNPIVLTPASIVRDNTVQAIQTGFNQLQNANDIDQMVGALFAGITSQVVGDTRGLSGLLQSTGGQPSYLDLVAKQSNQGVRDSAINAALQIAGPQQQLEALILAAAKAILQKAASIAASIHASENACWNLVIQNVCASAPDASGNCQAKLPTCTPTTDPATGQTTTCPTAGTLKVSTSTYKFSEKAIAAGLQPYIDKHTQVASTSKAAFDQIGSLIAQLTDTSSYTSQLSALQKLDQLMAQHLLHTPQDVTNEQQAQSTLVGSNGGSGYLDQVLTTINQAWGDSTDPKTGWCNMSSANPNKSQVIQAWQTCWSSASSSSCIYN